MKKIEKYLSYPIWSFLAVEFLTKLKRQIAGQASVTHNSWSGQKTISPLPQIYQKKALFRVISASSIPNFLKLHLLFKVDKKKASPNIFPEINARGTTWKRWLMIQHKSYKTKRDTTLAKYKTKFSQGQINAGFVLERTTLRWILWFHPANVWVQFTWSISCALKPGYRGRKLLKWLLNTKLLHTAGEHSTVSCAKASTLTTYRTQTLKATG